MTEELQVLLRALTREVDRLRVENRALRAKLKVLDAPEPTPEPVGDITNSANEQFTITRTTPAKWPK
jgi:hypothetical protein